MNDDQRDERIEMLTDALAETNRSMAEANRSMAETNRVVAETSRVVAATSRSVAALADHREVIDRQLAALIEVSADSVHDIGSLGRLMYLHLEHDHDYPDPRTADG